MPWSPALTQLRNVLADLYPDMADARRVVAQAGLRTGHIPLQGAAVNVWHAILDEAQKQGQVAEIIQVAQDDYSAHQGLRDAARAWEQAGRTAAAPPSEVVEPGRAAVAPPPHGGIPVERAALLALLTQRLSASDLGTLCFTLNVDYEDLPGEAKPDKARELILYLERRGRLSDLVPALRALRPDIDQDSSFVVPPSGGSSHPREGDRPDGRTANGDDSSLVPPLGGSSAKTVILFLASDPTDATRLRLGEEAREIQERLDRAKLRDRFELVTRWSVRAADVIQALLDVQPQVVHFSGHGEGAEAAGGRAVKLVRPQGVETADSSAAAGGLYFEDALGQAQLAPTAALAALFEQFADQVRCVLLNACYSEVQARAIAQHIPYVVGMRRAIGDPAAIAFSAGFYMGLGAGRVVESAYKLGCVQIGLQGIPEDLTPVLFKSGEKQNR